MNNQDFINNAFNAAIYYIYLTLGDYPIGFNFVDFKYNNTNTLYINTWNSPAPQPSIATLQSYTLQQVQDAYIHFAVKNNIIIINGQSYSISNNVITGTIPKIIGYINDISEFNNPIVYETYALSFLESSDIGYCINLYDSTNKVLISSDSFSNTTQQWNRLSVPSSLPINDNSILEIQAFTLSNTATVYIDTVVLNYYHNT